MDITKTMGVDINADHAGLVICMVMRLGRTVDIGMGDNLVGDMVLRFLRRVLGHLHLRDILGSSWFQLLWPCHIEYNLKYCKDCLENKVKSCKVHPVRQLW